MAGPWENYAPAQSPDQKPWEKYGAAPDASKPQEPSLVDRYMAQVQADKTKPEVRAPAGWGEEALGTVLTGPQMLLHTVSGMAAPVLGNIGGTAASGYEKLTGGKVTGDEGEGPEAFRRHIQDSFTYQPRGTIPQYLTGLTDKGLSLPGRAINYVSAPIGNAIRGNNASDTFRGAAGNFVQEAIPQAISLAGVKGAPKIAAPIADSASGALRSGAESLMQSALKPTAKDFARGKAQDAIKTMLNENIPLSKKGMENVRERVVELNRKIKESIKNSSGVVKLSDIEPLIKERLQDSLMQANPAADIESVNAAWDEFKNHPLISGRDEIPVQLAQEIKQGTYKKIASSYGEKGASTIETQKAIARGLKEGISKDSPEVAAFNKEEQRLIRTLNLGERRLLMDANRNPLGLSILTHNPGTWAAFMLDKSSAFKAMVARILNAAGEKVPFQTKAPEAPMAAPAAGNPVPPPIARPAAAIPEQFRTPQEKSRAIRDADQFGMPPGRKLREWYYSDENPNNPLK